MNLNSPTVPVVNDTLHVGAESSAADALTRKLATELAKHRSALLTRFQPVNLHHSDFRNWILEHHVRFIGQRDKQQTQGPAAHTERLEIDGKSVAEIRIEWFNSPLRYDVATIVYE